MDEAPEDRRKRLKAMRSAAGKPSTGDTMEPGGGDSESSGKKVKFRNYQPYDASLLLNQGGEADGVEEEEGAVYKSMRVESSSVDADNANDGAAGSIKPRDKKKDKKQIPTDAIIEELKAAEKSVKNTNHASEKVLDPTQDLKDQIEGKLSKLRRRTQKSIVDILRSSGAT